MGGGGGGGGGVGGGRDGVEGRGYEQLGSSKNEKDMSRRDEEGGEIDGGGGQR